MGRLQDELIRVSNMDRSLPLAVVLASFKLTLIPLFGFNTIKLFRSHPLKFTVSVWVG